MAQSVFLLHGVRLEVDHEDVQGLQQAALLQHVSHWSTLYVLEKQENMINIKPILFIFCAPMVMLN